MSVKRTVDAGLAPQIVYAKRSPDSRLVLLEDVAASMSAFNHNVNYLIAALKARGVAIEHWIFDSNPSALWGPGYAASKHLSGLARERSNDPLLIISNGEIIDRVPSYRGT